MNEFIKLPLLERNAIIANAAEKKNLSIAIVEKDFWVCWTLNYLFHLFKYKQFICFKGGTSLSKVYHVIERFSEDIDLSIDWSLLNINEDIAYGKKSNRQQDIFNKGVNKKTEKYIETIIVPLIKNDFSQLINDEFEVFVDRVDQHTICFKYPQSYYDSSILQVIRVEFGVLAEPFPASHKIIKSYVSEIYPSIFENNNILVKVVDIERTFFEKITILHREVNRINRNYPMRYSRHYYDLYQMILYGVGEEALNSLNILEKVVFFKKRFYPCPWAMYDEVLKGDCLLIPNKEAIEYFKEDYNKMRSMIYGKVPEFNEIIYRLKKFEEILNKKVLEGITIK